MDQSIQAIYEHGVFKPLSPIELNEREVVSITIGPPAKTSPPKTEDRNLADRQREALLRFVEEVKSMPNNNPMDGLTNRDHDQILYGPKS